MTRTRRGSGATGPAARVSRAALPAAYRDAARRAARVSVAALGGFYLFLYGVDSATAATYALFGAVALGGLSHVPGTGRQRAAQILRLTPWCWVLVTLGTFLAVRTWSAVVGMLVIGFALAFLAVAGPRAAGAAPGLQLLYIMPSFPPYDPGSLDERLAGTTVGLGLLVLAEAFLFREPAALPYRARVAAAARLAGRCAGALTAPPYTLSAAEVRDAHAAAQGLRPSRVPEADRPAGPGARDRALAHAGLAARALLSRLALLGAAPQGADTDRVGPEVLGAVGRAADGVAARLADADLGVAAGSDPDRKSVV